MPLLLVELLLYLKYLSVNTEWFLTKNNILMLRGYGKWVARNPIIVLGSSLVIVLLLCLGLIRFKVETRPEKVRLAFTEYSLVM